MNFTDITQAQQAIIDAQIWWMERVLEAFNVQRMDYAALSATAEDDRRARDLTCKIQAVEASMDMVRWYINKAKSITKGQILECARAHNDSLRVLLASPKGGN